MENLPSQPEQPPSGPYRPPSGSPPVKGYPASVVRNAERSSGVSVSRWLWLVVLVLAIISLPFVVRQVYRDLVYDYYRARADAARESLSGMELSNLEVASRNVARVSDPSVVHIRTTKFAQEGESRSFGIPRAYATRGEGAGVIVDADGYIVTNLHVVESSPSIDVELVDGRRFEASLVGSDPLTDIAVLKVQAEDLRPLPWGDSDNVEIGSLVWAVGSPFGLTGSVSFGILSAKNRRGVNESGNVYQRFMQSDAAVNPGNSGGPLLNAKGEIVGINTAIIGEAFQGVSFSIPSNIAREVFEKIKQEGRVSRGYLGVRLVDIDKATARQLGMQYIRGVGVSRVVRGSPASEAGIRSGDIILSWNGNEISSSVTLTLMIAATPVGSRATATVLRDGKEVEVAIRIVERPGVPRQE